MHVHADVVLSGLWNTKEPVISITERSKGMPWVRIRNIDRTLRDVPNMHHPELSTEPTVRFLIPRSASSGLLVITLRLLSFFRFSILFLRFLYQFVSAASCFIFQFVSAPLVSRLLVRNSCSCMARLLCLSTSLALAL